MQQPNNMFRQHTESTWLMWVMPSCVRAAMLPLLVATNLLQGLAAICCAQVNCCRLQLPPAAVLLPLLPALTAPACCHAHTAAAAAAAVPDGVCANRWNLA